LIAGIQSSHSRKRLAVILSIAEESRSLKFKQISSGIPISVISQQRGAFPPELNAGELVSVNVNAISVICSLQRAPDGYG
jgi:hypothetical protein